MQSAAQRLAGSLVERLRPVVPTQVVLAAEAGGVTIADPTVPHAWCHVSVDVIVEQDGDALELIQTAAYSVLSEVQDFVAELTAQPWPGRGRELPLPATEWVQDELHAWYGRAEAPVVQFAPLNLEALTGG